MPRLHVIAIALLVGVGVLSAPADAAEALPGSPSALGWRSCADPELEYLELECATLQVPRDHADPGGATIRLALTRRLHTDSTYQGVMLTNPGGPGGSGLTLPVLSDYVPEGAGAGYDWIGFDPRGVGASSPSLRCDRGYFGADRPNYVPRRDGILRYWLRKSRAYAGDCSGNAAKRALLPHLRTTDTVQDMEAIRQALGAETLNYYGFSYGTYLGQVYATRYPTRVGRFVLDGVVDPGRVWYAANLDQDRAFARNLSSFWRYVARYPGTFRLGRDWREIRRGFYRTRARLDRQPAASGRLGPSELTDVMLGAGYYVHDWLELGLDYSALARRNQGGSLFARYRESEMGDDNPFAVYNAVQCTDAQWPGWVRTGRDARRVHRQAPFITWGNTWYNSPCLSWRAPAGQPPTVSGTVVTSRILLISETRDAATPYAGALAVRRLFPSASLVAGVGGTTHASSLSGVPCVDNTVATYLRTGALPARSADEGADRRCPRLEPMQPGSDSSGLRAQQTPPDQLSPLLRRDLQAAQRSGG